MKLALLVVCLVVPSALAAGAGRAFPIDSENYVVEQFQIVNSRIKWDPTNFLVDLSGNYANCDAIGKRGSLTVDRQTPEGARIGGVVDWIQGSEAHTNAVNGYIKAVIDNWMREGVHDSIIRDATHFGCSVRPGCKGRVSIACLFDNVGSGDHGDLWNQRALAFTPQQYAEAEAIVGNEWDRSHFLENLSGYETDCHMLEVTTWSFPSAQKIAAEYGLAITGMYGFAENRGSTPVALAKILLGFKKINFAKGVGCSIIPDCIDKNKMYAVVSCIYME